MAEDRIEIGSDETDFAGIFIYEITKDGFLDILVFDYTKDGRTCKKVPGGCMSTGDKNIYDTAVNELEQETNFVANPQDLVHVWTNYKDQGVHHQHFFAVELSKLTGDVRKDVMFDNDEKLGPPKPVDLDNALQMLFPSHRKGLEKMIRVMGSRNREFRHAASRYPKAARLLADR